MRKLALFCACLVSFSIQAAPQEAGHQVSSLPPTMVSQANFAYISFPESLFVTDSLSTSTQAKKASIINGQKHSLSLMSEAEKPVFNFNENWVNTNNQLQGLDYQYSGAFGATSVKLLTSENGVTRAQSLDLSYGYPFLFNDNKIKVSLNLGANYIDAESEQEQLNQTLISPYVSVEGHWQLLGNMFWIYNLKYQMSQDEVRISSPNMLDDSEIEVFTGFSYNF